MNSFTVAAYSEHGRKLSDSEAAERNKGRTPGFSPAIICKGYREDGKQLSEQERIERDKRDDEAWEKLRDKNHVNVNKQMNWWQRIHFWFKKRKWFKQRTFFNL